MGEPITWRNINAPDLGDPSRTLLGAQQAFNQAFAPIQEQLKAYRTMQDENWQVGRNNNTEAFLSQLASRYTTPEAYKAALASGDVQALRDQFGAYIDQSRAREAMDGMLPKLMQRDLTSRQYTNQVEQDELAPKAEIVRYLASRGLTEQARGWMAADPKLLNAMGGKLGQEILAIERNAAADARAQQQLDDSKAYHDGQLRLQRQRLAAERAAANNKDPFTAAVYGRVKDIAQNNLKNSPMGDGVLGTAAGDAEARKQITEGLKARGITDPKSLQAAESIIMEFRGTRKVGETPYKMPVSWIVGAVLANAKDLDNTYFSNPNPDKIKKQLAGMFEDPERQKELVFGTYAQEVLEGRMDPIQYWNLMQRPPQVADATDTVAIQANRPLAGNTSGETPASSKEARKVLPPPTQLENPNAGRIGLQYKLGENPNPGRVGLQFSWAEKKSPDRK